MIMKYYTIIIALKYLTNFDNTSAKTIPPLFRYQYPALSRGVFFI